MAEIWTQYGIGSVPQLITFADERIHELKEQIRKATAEKEMWEKLKERLNPCRTCKGLGGTRERTRYPEYQKCVVCEGTGESKTE